ncbi:lipopolysaccharide biosynthesis protein [Xenophilus aerolatus]
MTEIDNGLSLALKARGRFDLPALLEGSTRAAFFGLTYAVVPAGGAAALPIALAISMTLAKGVFKWIALNPSGHSKPIDSAHTTAIADRVRGELRTSGHWIWLSLVGALMFNAIDRWLVGAYLGAQLLVVYATCLQIAQAPHSIVAAIGQPLIGWAAAFREKGQDLTLWAPLGIATLLAGIPSAILLIFLEPLMAAWISSDFATNNLSTARYLTLAFLVLSMNVPAYYCLLGLGRTRTATLPILFASAVYTAGCVALPPTLIMFIGMKFVYPVITLGLILSLMNVVKDTKR